MTPEEIAAFGAESERRALRLLVAFMELAESAGEAGDAYMAELERNVTDIETLVLGLCNIGDFLLRETARTLTGDVGRGIEVARRMLREREDGA